MLRSFALRDLHPRVILAFGGVLVLERPGAEVGSWAPRPLRAARDRQPERGSAGCADNPDRADLALGQAWLGDRPESHVDDPPAVGFELSRHHSSRFSNRTLELPAQGARDPAYERRGRDPVATARPRVVDSDLADARQKRPPS